MRLFKKLYWKLSGFIASVRYPVNNEHIYIGVTGTDGKTTTCSFIYEIAKAYGYKPLLLTTVSATFEDKKIDAHLKSTSFVAYSVKTFLVSLKKLQLGKACKNLLFLDKTGYIEQSETHRTTPLASEIRKLIREYTKKGANMFILETTSHALDQYRTYGLQFDTAVITNITNEHLDYHGNWENYAAAKATLIKQLKPGGSIALNSDDTRSFTYLTKYVNKLSHRKINGISFGIHGKAETKEFWIHLQPGEKHTEVKASQYRINNDALHAQVKLFGNYNVYNALAAFSAFIGLAALHPELHDGWKVAAEALQNLHDVSGRMNFLHHDPEIIVDFAHTPNAFKQSLSSVSTLLAERRKKGEARLWVVFGTAGLRDAYKRPEMGKIAFDYCDNLLITSEDPRTEDLHEINNQIISGFKEDDDEFTILSYFDGLKYEPSIEDKFILRFDEPTPNSRRNALKFAIQNAGNNDIVIILGKGHETTICYGSKEFPWNDIDEVKRELVQLEKVEE